MKQAKLQILLTMLFIAVGIAAVSTNLIIEGNSAIVSNTDDFLVYFSNASVDGVEKLSIVKTEKELVFNAELSAVGDKKNVGYDVTNASKNYDARVSISCTGGNEYLKVTNSFDEKNDLTARSTKSGTLTVELINAVSAESIYEVKCTINANAIERESINTGDVVNPLSGSLIGKEVVLAGETFNIISVGTDTVSLFARYNLGSDYKQIVGAGDWITFSELDIEYATVPTDIDVQIFGGNVKTYINAYVEYLEMYTGDLSITGNLITLRELGDLGCTVPADYAYGSGEWTCVDSPYIGWLNNGSSWWTRSVVTDSDYCLFLWDGIYDGRMGRTCYVELSGVRPVITISKSTYDEFAKEIFSLEIDSHTFSFVEGMTWGEWVESEYNTEPISVNSDGTITMMRYNLFNGDDWVYSTDIVDPNGIYSFSDAPVPR